MNKLLRYRRFIINTIGILLVMLSVGTSKTAHAATATSDISLTLVADKHNVKMGQTVTYTATMTDNGPDDAIAVDVGIFLPDQLNLVSITCDQGISPDSPFCEYGSLAAGETVVSEFVVTPAPSIQKHQRKLTADASVFFEIDCSFDPNCTFDPDLSNNSASLMTKVIGKLAHP